MGAFPGVVQNSFLLLPKFDVPIGEVDEVTPTIVDSPGKSYVHERPPLRPLRLFQKRHSGLMRKPVPLARVARDAGADDVFPCCLTATIAGEDVVDVEVVPLEDDSAILAGVLVAFKDVVTGELDLFSREAIKETQNNNPRDPDSERDGLEHPRLRIGNRKIFPTHKIMREEVF